MTTEATFKPGSANDAAQFAQFTGTDHYYKTLLPGYKMTDGVYSMAEALGCHWLIDTILSYQLGLSAKMTPFQVWKLKRNDTGGCRVWMEDGNDNEVLSRGVEYTDFPYEEATIWLTDRTLLLPSEY